MYTVYNNAKANPSRLSGDDGRLIYLLIRKECLSYVQWYYSTVEFHSLLYKLYKSRSRLSDFNHSICSYSYRPRRSFLSCLRRIWARSRLGPWCAKPCQVSACLPLSIWCLTSSPWRDATFTIGTVVGRPWAHWKHRDVAFSSSIIRQHSDGSKGSPNMIAPIVSQEETSTSHVLSKCDTQKCLHYGQLYLYGANK